MRKISLSEIKEAFEFAKIPYTVLVQKESQFTGIGTDTRKNLKDQLFIALAGEAFDAHNFLKMAVDQGATALLVHQTPDAEVLQREITVIKVEDTLKALHALGSWAREKFKGKVIGITGSNGKTTSKEFTAALIAPYKKVHFNKGSFNNHWGVPFTLLQTPDDADVAVIEMGMNHAGELTDLSAMVRADSVVCTTVGRAHIEHFGSLEKIAEAKAEIYTAASASCCFVFNLDNLQTKNMYQAYKDKSNVVLTFSQVSAEADVHFILDSMGLDHLIISGKIRGVSGQVRVPVFGEHNVVNLMAAAALALSVGVSPEEIWRALPQCKSAWGRNQLYTIASGAQIVFDAYNANPDSMRALLSNVSKIKNFEKKIGVFGEMLEMGPTTGELHREVAQAAAQCGFAKIYFIGKPHVDFVQGLKDQKFAGQVWAAAEFDPEMGKDLELQLQNNSLAVLKGSRGMKLERFMQALGVSI